MINHWCTNRIVFIKNYPCLTTMRLGQLLFPRSGHIYISLLFPSIMSEDNSFFLWFCKHKMTQMSLKSDSDRSIGRNVGVTGCQLATSSWMEVNQIITNCQFWEFLFMLLIRNAKHYQNLKSTYIIYDAWFARYIIDDELLDTIVRWDMCPAPGSGSQHKVHTGTCADEYLGSKISFPGTDLIKCKIWYINGALFQNPNLSRNWNL